MICKNCNHDRKMHATAKLISANNVDVFKSACYQCGFCMEFKE